MSIFTINTINIDGGENVVIAAGRDVRPNQPLPNQGERRPASAGSRYPIRKLVLAAALGVPALLVTTPLSWRAGDHLLPTVQTWHARGEISGPSPTHGVSRPPTVRGVSLLLDQAGQFLSNGAPDLACDQFRLAWQGLAAEDRARIDVAEIRTAESECSGREFPTGANRYERAFQPISHPS